MAPYMCLPAYDPNNFLPVLEGSIWSDVAAGKFGLVPE